MSQTQRSLTAIFALLANNITRDISPQDHRDSVATLQISYGEIFVSSALATTIPNTTDYFDIAGTYGLGVTGSRFDMNTNGQLRYIGAAPIEAIVLITLSITIAGNNDIVHMRAAKNGTSMPATETEHKVGTGADVSEATIIGLTSLNTNDFLTAEVRNADAADDVTAEHANILAIGFAV